MKIQVTTSLAGKLSRQAGWQITVAGLLTISASGALAQQIPTVRQSAVSTPPPAGPTQPAAPVTPAAGAPTPAVPDDPESSVTVQQIVQRQEDHFARIKNAQGTVIHSEVQFDEKGQAQPPSVQYIFFAYEGPRSVTLTMPLAAAQIYKGSQGKVPWQHITSAYHVTGDAVYVIKKPEGATTAPTVYATQFNPAVHENNPLVAFHPRQVSDEQIALRDLVRAIPNMAQRPKVFDVVRDGKLMLRLEFANPNTPGERLYYIIDPSRGYLPVEISRTSGGRPVSTSKVIIGHTPDGTWIPARRERTMYKADGSIASRQNWHYEYLSVNQGLAPKALSLMFFNLPLNTKINVVGAKGGTAQSGRTTGSAAAVRRTPVPRVMTPTPIPTRTVPQPMRVPLN